MKIKSKLLFLAAISAFNANSMTLTGSKIILDSGREIVLETLAALPEAVSGLVKDVDSIKATLSKPAQVTSNFVAKSALVLSAVAVGYLVYRDFLKDYLFKENSDISK